MAWKSVLLTQNGNSTVTWSFGPHSSISSHDAIVVGPVAGGSRCSIDRIRVRTGPVNYHITVSVTGGNAMTYRLFAEQMN
jgi:hypothetical protein